jgi:NitT/TauT family transport system permease protein
VTRAAGPRRAIGYALGAALIAAGVGVALLGAVSLFRLLARLPAEDWFALARALGLTALRVLLALAVALVWTIPLGLWIGRSRRVARVLQPLVQLAASFPAPMLYPFVVPRLRELGAPPDLVAAGLMMLGTAWYVLFNVAAGAAATPLALREAAAVFRLPPLRRFVLLDLAALLPFLATGLVTAAGGAWNASIVAESVAYPGGAFEVDGVGAWIARAFAHGDHPRLAAATVALAAALVTINRVCWKPLQRTAAVRFAAR